MREFLVITIAVALLAVVAGVRLSQPADASAASARVFELRTYTAAEGKLDALLARFRDHTLAIFEKHGMTSIGYWVPTDQPNTLIYMLAHDSREAAEASWAAFREDPEWLKVRADSEVDGRLTTNVQSVFMSPTDFSPMQ